jgi:hypothetical protein
MAYPVTFDVQMPKEFDKAQVVLRIILVLLIAHIASWVLSGGAYIILPVVAAILISQHGGAKYLADAQPGPVKWLRYMMMFYSYVALATDKLVTQDPEQVVQLNITPTGTPTAGNALARIVWGIPHAIALVVIGTAFVFIWLIAAGSILVNGTQPGWTEDFIRGYLRWNARLLAYMASLVDEYPPFSFSNGDSATAMPAPTPPAAQ